MHPATTGAPHPDMSPIRTADRLPISTVPLPLVKGDGGWLGGGGKEQACMSPITAAGMPPMSTVPTPGPVMVPGCPVGSPTRAAAGIASLLSSLAVSQDLVARRLASRQLEVS
jgi:hypothetical protein